MSNSTISIVDLVIILAYLLIIVLIGILTVKRKKVSSEGFFLAGRSLNWGMIGAALFAANISTIHMVGLAANGFKDGIVWGNFEWMATFLLIILALFFAPFYFKNRISTLPEFLEKRYGPRSRSFFAFIVVITALFSHIGVSLYAGAVVLKTIFGVDVMVSIIVISVITTLYSILGGLRTIGSTFESSVKTGTAGYVAIREGHHSSLVCHTVGLSGTGYLLLVCRSDHCTESTGGENIERCPERTSVCGISKDITCIYYGISGYPGIRSFF